MLYLRMCFDHVGMESLRAVCLQEHRNYIASFLTHRNGVCVEQGGPILDDAEASLRGSFLVIDAESMGSVKIFHDGDPFVLANLFDVVHLVPWERHVGNNGNTPYVP